MDTIIKNINISKLQKKTIISTSVWGILAHMFMFVNKFSEYDEVYYINSVGGTLQLGRWFLFILQKIMDFLFHGTYSTPWLIGCVSIAIFICINLLLIDIFKITDDVAAIVISGVMILTPATLGIFYFTYTAPYYFLSLFMILGAVYILRKGQESIRHIVISAMMIACAMGIYQAMFTVVALVLFFICLGELLWTDRESKEVLIRGIKYCVAMLGGVAGYFVINKLIMVITHTAASSYRGMDRSNISEFLRFDYIQLLKVLFDVNDSMYYFKIFVENVSVVYQISIICICIICIVCIVRAFVYKDILRGILIFLLLILMPIVANPFAIVDVGMVTTLMLMSRCVFFIFFVVLMSNTKVLIHKESIAKLLLQVSLILVAYTNVYYVYYDNRCYTEAEFRKTEAISWMTTLISQIKGLDDFDENMKIAYIQNGEMLDATYNSDKSLLSADERLYYGDIRKHYSWKEFMKLWCGFALEEADNQVIENIKLSEEYKQMPLYPNDGSIKIFDEVIVVKFNDK